MSRCSRFDRRMTDDVAVRDADDAMRLRLRCGCSDGSGRGGVEIAQDRLVLVELQLLLEGGDSAERLAREVGGALLLPMAIAARR